MFCFIICVLIINGMFQHVEYHSKWHRKGEGFVGEW